MQTKKTFRDLIYEYLDKNDKQWSKLGIDILLGKPTDAVMQQREVMFLPEYLLAALDKTTIDNRKIVSGKNQLYEVNEQPVIVNYFEHPFLFLLVYSL